MSDLKSLKEQYEKLGEEIKKLEQCDKLRLGVCEDNRLRVVYKGINILSIDDEGYIHNGSTYAYEQWRNDGMPIDSDSVVRWREGEYKLSVEGMLYRDDAEVGEFIYSFSECVAIKPCFDPNIKCYKHNGRPVIT